MATVRVSLEDKISLGRNSFSSVTISAFVEREVDDSDISGGLRETAEYVEEFMATERAAVLAEISSD